LEVLVLDAENAKDAQMRGGKILQDRVNEARKEFVHSGTFTVRVEEIYEGGRLVYQSEHAKYQAEHPEKGFPSSQESSSIPDDDWYY
jgi:hypothetical protein